MISLLVLNKMYFNYFIFKKNVHCFSYFNTITTYPNLPLKF